VAIVVVVGLLGVGGGVAATVYTLKAPSKAANLAPPRPSTVIQAATPVSVAAIRVAESAQAEAPEANVVAGETRGSPASSGSPEAQTASGRPAPKSVKSVSAPVINKSATPDTMPAKASTAPFNRDAALAVLGIAASQAASCKRPGGPAGTGKALVTFDSGGRVITVNVVGGEIAGTPVARCVASLFQRVKVAPFAGDRQTVSKGFTIPQ
jgi:hypothetical protein